MTDKLSCCGIDVSHLTLDVTYQNNLGELFYLQVGNNNAGFKKLIEHTGQNCHFVMEATGVYYIRLAFFLDSLGCKLSVVNAMSIKRYIQMHLERNKTDKKDSRWICHYAIDQRPPFWQMPDSAYFECKQIYNTIREYAEQVKRINNQLHSETVSRAFSRFQEEGLVAVQQKHIRILDTPGLKRLLNHHAI